MVYRAWLGLFVVSLSVTAGISLAEDQSDSNQPKPAPLVVQDGIFTAALRSADENFSSDSSQPQFADIQETQPATTQKARSSPDVVSSFRPTTQLSPASAATQPEASSAANGNFPAVGGSFGLDEFANHFAPYEPMYFVGGGKSPNVKFQFSIRYRLLTPSGPLATEHPLLKGFNFAYSQTSLWDFNGPSSPFFFDSSYRPELFYLLENIPSLKLPPAWQVGFQTGFGHESNGKGGTDERSMNMLYFRPLVTLSDLKSGWFISLSPKFYGYILSLSNNPDIARYRGYDDLQFVVGLRDGLQLATEGHVGNRFDRGSVQFDLSYPLTKILRGNADLSLDLQYFDGYGESLLQYNKRTSVIRIGFSLLR